MRRFLAALFLVFAPLSASAQSGCVAPEPVCAAAARVVMLSGFEPVGSAVILEDGLLVTNRHMVADNGAVEVRGPDGKTVWAKPVPTSYRGDLILVAAAEIKSRGAWRTAAAKADSALYVIGFDVGRDAVRVYAPGKLIVPRADTPTARLHYGARALPGNSGGALVDADGNLVGIVASGGEGRNEAVPVDQLDILKKQSGPENADASAAIGAALRNCVEGLDAAHDSKAPIAPDAAAALQSNCIDSDNRQLFDMAAQVLGTMGYLEPAAMLLELSLAKDPNAPNALISMAVTYHIGQRYGEEIPLLKRALVLLPDNPQLLRFALQAGVWGNDKALAEHAMQRIEAVLPEMAPAARRFYEQPPPPPKLKAPR